jgi:hypothetical protein
VGPSSHLNLNGRMKPFLIVWIGLSVSQICCSSNANNSNLWQAKGIEEQDATSEPGANTLSNPFQILQ